MTTSSHSTKLRSTQFLSSRTLPGHECVRATRKRAGAKCLHGPVLAIEPLEKEPRQQFDVVRTLAQRRQPDDEHGEPVVEILAEPPVANDRLRRVIRSRHDPDVDGDFLAAADAHHAAGFEHAQQLRLQVERHLGDLVEKQGAARRHARNSPDAASSRR